MAAELATITNKTEDVVCYSPMMITTNGVWQGENPLDFALPLFILQLTLVVILTRILVLILKPFRQPRVIAEILVSFIIFSSIYVVAFSISIRHNIFVLENLAYIMFAKQ